jgi:hypothetical protein
MRKIEEESLRRLSEAERRGTSEAKNRKRVLEQQAPSEPSYRTSVGRDEKSPGQVLWDRAKDAANRRAAQVCYRSKEGYGELAKPRKATTPK